MPEDVEIDHKAIDENKDMASGMRDNSRRPLSDDDIETIRKEIQRLRADERKFVFNDPEHIQKSTCYNYKDDIVYVTRNVLPDTTYGSTHPRDLMSIACVLAYEYYGHRAFRDEYLNDVENGGDYLTTPYWKDECRASLHAARVAPGLTQQERASLVMEAVFRAQEAGQYIKVNDPDP